MSIYSFVLKRFEDGAWTGVPRFDFQLQLAFPKIRSVIKPPQDLSARDCVITDNHLSLQIPESIKTIVVHHGCAAVHFDRDPYWRNRHTEAIVSMQGQMIRKANRIFAAPSAWVADAFKERYRSADYRPIIIPHWVELIGPGRPKRNGKPVIIGDWRDHNKGCGIAQQLRQAIRGEWDFRPLNFQGAQDRDRQYAEASLYLCLSQSEGGSFSVCDAEAAELPIVTTNVGNYREFDDCEVIDWRLRDKTEYIIEAVRRKLREGRKKESFYKSYRFEHWRQEWQAMIQ